MANQKKKSKKKLFAAFHGNSKLRLGPWRATAKLAEADATTFVIRKSAGKSKNAASSLHALEVDTVYAAYCLRDDEQVGPWRELLIDAEADAARHKAKTSHSTTTVERES